MKRLILLLTLALAVSGCAYGKVGLLNSYVAAGFSAEQEDAVAEDLAGLLAEKFPPGRSSIHLKVTGAHDGLGQKLENALRSRGFTLAAEPAVSAPAVAYVLDQLGEGHCYARLTVAGGPTLTRSYAINDGRLEVQALAVDAGR